MGLLTFSDQCVGSRCNWETYERLLKENEDNSSPRFTYDRGWLEIMSPSLDHEKINAALRALITSLADHLSFDYQETGSTTFRRQDLQRGFEPDSSYYFKHVDQLRTATRLDLSQHPGPGLVVEVEVHHSSINKLELYHEIGVEEVWRWSKNQLVILLRTEHQYEVSEVSCQFPRVPASQLTHLVFQSIQLTRPEWNRTVRAWLEQL